MSGRNRISCPGNRGAAACWYRSDRWFFKHGKNLINSTSQASLLQKLWSVCVQGLWKLQWHCWNHSVVSRLKSFHLLSPYEHNSLPVELQCPIEGVQGSINKRLWAQPIVSAEELGKMQETVGRCSEQNEGIKTSKNLPVLVRASLSVLEERSSWRDCLSLPHPL